MSVYYAKPMQLREDEPKSWYVFWERRDGTAYGAQGVGLSREGAMHLAADILEGRVKP